MAKQQQTKGESKGMGGVERWEGWREKGKGGNPPPKGVGG